MLHRPFGKTDMTVGVLGFGGAEIGFEKASEADVSRILGAAIDAGLNVIDTAECYLDSESLIGSAVGSRRDEFHLFTKCGHPDGPGSTDWSPDSIVKSIERSLKRLKTDRVDLVQLHSCSEDELRKGDVIAALHTAREKGLTRYIGYSGDGHAALFAVESGAFDSLQTSVSIADQESIELTLPLASAKGMGVIAKRPIANAAWRYESAPENAYHRPYWDRLQALDFDFLRAADPGSIALRFTLAAPGVDTMIVGTTKPDRWRGNASILDAGPLPAAEFDAIRARWKAVADDSWTGQI